MEAFRFGDDAAHREQLRQMLVRMRGRAQARVSGVVWPLSQVFGGTPEDL